MAEARDATTLRRGLDLLAALGSDAAALSGGLGVTQLAELTGEDKGQVSRTLKVLLNAAWIERDVESQAYRLGWHLYALAARAGDRRLVEEGATLLRGLVRDLGERAHLSVLQGREVLTVWTESPTVSVQATGWVGRTVPAWCTSSGRALLVDHDQEDLAELFAGIPFTSAGGRGPADVQELFHRVASVAASGYALADEEFEPGLVAVAAPVRAHHGRVVAAVNVSGPKFRLGQRLTEAVERTMMAAEQLTRLLGGGSSTRPADLQAPSGDSHRSCDQPGASGASGWSGGEGRVFGPIP